MGEDVKRVSRTLISKGAIFEYYRDHMQFSNGNEADWDFIKHRGAASVVPVLPDGRIVMVRQFRNALDRYTLEIPAGGLNPDESYPEDTMSAAVRELEEETGYVCDKLEKLITTASCVAYSSELIDIYVARDLKPGRLNPDEDEFIDVSAHTVEEISQLIFEGKIQDSKTISAIMAYRVKYGV